MAAEDIVTLQLDASVLRVVLAMVIALINSISAGTAVAFSTTAAVVYRNATTTTLPQVLDEDQTSWLSTLIRHQSQEHYNSICFSVHHANFCHGLHTF